MIDIIDIFAIDMMMVNRFLVSILLAIILGLVIAVIYRITHKGVNYESSFLSTLVLLAPIVTLVMFFIQGDLVLSLGLVGSLSIIRFRTPIKDTKDMVYLFWTIAMGLGIGTLNWTLSIIATVILSGLMLLFYYIRYGRKKHNQYILMVSGMGQSMNVDELFANETTIKSYLRSKEIYDNRYELVYELSFDDSDLSSVHQLIDQLQQQSTISKVSLLSPQLNLPM